MDQEWVPQVVGSHVWPAGFSIKDLPLSEINLECHQIVWQIINYVSKFRLGQEGVQGGKPLPTRASTVQNIQPCAFLKPCTFHDDTYAKQRVFFWSCQRECHLKMIGQEQVPRVMGGHVWPEVFSVKLMILVDRAGSQWPVTGHAPWNGCNLADLVLPFVLFSVGMGFPLSLKANSCRCWTSEEVVISCCTKNRGTIGNKIVANLVYVQII